MIRRHQRHQRFVQQRLGVEFVAGNRRPAEAQVELAATHPLEQLKIVGAVEGELDVGPAAADGGKHHREDAKRRGRVVPDRQLADLAVRGLAGQRQPPARLSQQMAGLIQEDAPGVGQPQAAFFPNEQIGPDLHLEFAHVHAERRRRDVQVRRGLAQVLSLGHRDEIAKLTKVHEL